MFSAPCCTLLPDRRITRRRAAGKRVRRAEEQKSAKANQRSSPQGRSGRGISVPVCSPETLDCTGTSPHSISAFVLNQRTLLGIKLGVALSSHVNVACPARRQSQPERVCKDQDQVSQLAGDLLLCAPAQLALKEACGRTALSSCALTRSTDDLDLSFACSRGGPVRLLVAPDARFECCCCSG